MRQLHIQGVTRRRFRTGTTRRAHGARPAPDLVGRDFSADGPDRLWLTDITQMRTGFGWLYLAVVLDAWWSYPELVDTFECWDQQRGGVTMAGSGRRYAPEFKARMVELVRAGSSPDRLAKEFEPSATAIRRWVERADVDEGHKAGLTTAERREVRDLKREFRRVKIERDILAKAAAWFARESGRIPRGGSGS